LKAVGMTSRVMTSIGVTSSEMTFRHDVRTIEILAMVLQPSDHFGGTDR